MDTKTFTSFVLIYCALTLVGGESIALTHPGWHKSTPHPEVEVYAPMNKGRFTDVAVVSSSDFVPSMPLWYEVNFRR